MSLFHSLPDYWQTELEDLRFRINEIEHALTNEANNSIRILPDKQNVFRALEVMPCEAKVVIVGQDPYPNIGHACGLSFSVPPNTRPLAGSLRNMLKEVESDTGYKSIASDGDLTAWVSQGVVLLNRVLTVRHKESGSHHNLGWQDITDRIIKRYSEHAVGLLLGHSAQKTAHLFNKNLVVCGIHPSPLSAHKGFMGSKPFTAVNNILHSMNKDLIKW